MPVYNARPFLEAAVESMLAQTVPDFELLILNTRLQRLSI